MTRYPRRHGPRQHACGPVLLRLRHWLSHEFPRLCSSNDKKGPAGAGVDHVGRFRLDGLSPGQHSVAVQAVGYERLTFAIQMPHDGGVAILCPIKKAELRVMPHHSGVGREPPYKRVHLPSRYVLREGIESSAWR